METKAAVKSLAALSHEGRLSVFRLLVRAGPAGLAAGEIARRLEILPNTLSASLSVLSHAALVSSSRDGRSVIYSANYTGMTGLLSFLVEDCCGGETQICAPLTSVLNRACCESSPP